MFVEKPLLRFEESKETSINESRLLYRRNPHENRMLFKNLLIAGDCQLGRRSEYEPSWPVIQA